MAFPKIDACIVCEDLRQEKARKTTILGFFGLIPYVEISIRDFNQPLERLAFLLMGGPGEGTFSVALDLLDPSGKQILPLPLPTVQIPYVKSEKRSQFGFAIAPLKLTTSGEYKLRILVDGKPHYEAPFVARQGKEEEFA